MLGCRPGVVHAPARRYPEIVGPQGLRPTGEEQHLASIGPNRGARFNERGVELGYWERWSADVAALRHRDRIDVEQSTDRLPAEIKIGRAVFRALQVFRSCLERGRVHLRAESHGLTPPEVVFGVVAAR